MQDGEGAKAKAAGRARGPVSRGPGHARSLFVCAMVVLLLHVSLVARLGEALRFGSEAPPAGAAVRLRTLPPPLEATATEAAETEQAPQSLAELAAEAAGTEPAPRVAPRPPSHRKTTSAPPAMAAAASAASAAALSIAEASPAAPAASAALPASATMAAVPAVEGAAAPPPAEDAGPASRGASAGTLAAAEPLAAPAAGPTAAASAPPSLLAQGEAPPPTYPTKLPPPVTLHYEIRRGFLRGSGEIRWQPAAGAYTLALEARIAGLTLLTQTSSGRLDTDGLAPDRFVDQRPRRPAQAANFRRDVGRIAFWGPAVEWPLLAGSQDRLSWLIQLAGIAAAQPERLVEGGTIAMVVVGARGDAAVWTLRVIGSEDIETAAGSVHAVKLVSRGRGAAGTTAEVWLDPAHSWLPAHATLRNSAGDSEYDLLLERIEPGR